MKYSDYFHNRLSKTGNTYMVRRSITKLPSKLLEILRKVFFGRFELMNTSQLPSPLPLLFSCVYDGCRIAVVLLCSPRCKQILSQTPRL